jgi:NADPH:quinone reductase-like Zn-dependent oxidoreductase
MKVLAILGRDHPSAANADAFELEGVTIRCALLDVPDPAFDPARQPDHVLRMATSEKTTGFYVVGSDFVADVLAVGDNVTTLAPGDRVIPDCCWPPKPGRPHAGIPSNHASRSLQVLPANSVIPIPPVMDPAIAACFSIGAQTAHAMVRRLAPSHGERILLTAPHSNTAIMILAALAGLHLDIHAVTRNGRDADRLRQGGITNLVVAGDGPLATEPGFAAAIAAGGYHAVADPFSDLYLAQVVPMMAFGGRYVTCGIEDQSSAYTGVARQRSPAPNPMIPVMTRNLTILGNFLGTTDDLRQALARHQAGRFPVVLDSVFRDDPAGFLLRTYTAPDRFGKVAFLHG